MVESPKFDVFLAHNSADKPQVKAIAEELKRRGLKPWLDEEQIAPGKPFQDVIQQAIPQVKSVAIFIGERGLGDWQVAELRSAHTQSIKKGIPVIPVLLPNVNEIPEQLIFLQQYNWVNFVEGIDDREALDNLAWGISGKKAKLLSEIPVTGDEASEVGADYTNLRDFLDKKEFGKADYETAMKILWVAKREDYGRLDVLDLENLPSQDLRTINQLWLAASKERFGFSVQKQIWIDLGGKPGQYDDNVFNRFIEKVEWGENKAICFEQRAAKGHLPLGLYVKVEGPRERIHDLWWVKTEKIRKKEMEKIRQELELRQKKKSSQGISLKKKPSII